MKDGKCLLPSQFLSTNNIEYFSDQLEKHFSTMSKAFYISRVFKCFSHALHSIRTENSPHSLSNFSTILPSRISESDSEPIPLDSNPPILDIYPSSSLNCHTRSNVLHDFGLSSFTAEHSVPALYSNENNNLDPINFDVKSLTSTLQKVNCDNQVDSPAIECSDFQNPISSLSCVQSHQSNCTEVLSKDQFQLLIQNWMQIQICKFSDFFCSIYNDALKRTFADDTHSFEYASQASYFFHQ